MSDARCVPLLCEVLASSSNAQVNIEYKPKRPFGPLQLDLVLIRRMFVRHGCMTFSSGHIPPDNSPYIKRC